MNQVTEEMENYITKIIKKAAAIEATGKKFFKK